MRKFTISLMVLLSFNILVAVAVPAKRGQWKTVTLTDGSQVRVELVGDEFMHFWQAEDGRKFVQQAGTLTEVYRLADIERMQANAEQKRAARFSNHKARTRGIGDSQVYTGKKKGLIILAQFPDLKFKAEHDKAFYQRMINERGFQEGDFRGSVRDFFHDQSNGQFDLEFDIAGPYTLANSYKFYGQNDEDDNDKNPGKMIKEAIEKAAPEYDFTQFDWDGDNEVDQVFVVYAGQGEANGGNADTIWPHEWRLEYATGTAMNINNMRVDTYACGSELGGSENITSGIGTICHEFTHCLGIPDMYDTSSTSNYYGMGTWDVMCSGSYNKDGFCPAGYTSYEKAWCGWITPKELTEDAAINGMKPLSEGGEAYVIYNDNHRDEYYLLECRNKTGWDSSLAGTGLLVLHVDFDKDIWRWNAVNADKTYYDVAWNPHTNDHPRLTLIAGDNALSRNNEASDPFPFNLRNYLSNVSSPAATLYNKNTDGSFLMNKAIRDIQRNADGTVSFRFEAEDKQTEPIFEGTLFYESFDNCAGAGGNDGAWTATSSEFLPDNTGWDYDTKNAIAKGGMKCGAFGTRTTKGTVTTPKVFVGAESTLTFKAAPWKGDNNTRVSIIVLGSETTTLSPSTFTLAADKWTECEATIKGQGDITIRFVPSNNRFFLDEIKVVSNTTSGIQGITTQQDEDSRIYSLDGRQIGNDTGNLKHGIYIINKKKVIK